MIKFNAAPAFEFDEWATLYRTDPEAFEARRRALLAIEIAKGGRHAEAAKSMIARLEVQLDGKDDAERMRLSMLAMVASTRRMTERLTELARLMEARAAQRDGRPG